MAIAQKFSYSDMELIVMLPEHSGSDNFVDLNPGCLDIGCQISCNGSQSDATMPVGSEDERYTEVYETSRVLKRMCKERRLEEALYLLDSMEQRGIQAYPETYVHLLQVCIHMNALAEGNRIHAHIIKSRTKPTNLLWDTLVDMYAKCGRVVDARRVFDSLHERSVFTWTIIIAAYVQKGHFFEAFKLFKKMEHEGVKPDEVTFVSILKACAGLGGIERGRQIHIHLLMSGIKQNLHVENALVGMYAKCGSIEDAREMFENMSTRDIVSWNAMITGYAQHGNGEDALRFFLRMECEGVEPDAVTFVCILRACASLAALEKGKEIHAQLISSRCECNIFVGNTLVDMYAKCGCMEDARQVFDRTAGKDRVLWNAIIAGYAMHEHENEAFNLFKQMKQEGIKPNGVTFMIILNACASLAAGKRIHADIIGNGYESDLFVVNTVIDMYAKFGSIVDAHHIFDKASTRDVVSWNVMITGYTQHGHGEVALELFWHMLKEGVRPNKVTFGTILNACANTMALEDGKLIHALINSAGCEVYVDVGSTLIYMYAKCQSLMDAHYLFDKMSERSVVSWNAMIIGYSEHGPEEEALKIFQKMQMEDVKPDEVTFVTILNACAILSALDQGKQIHGHIINNGYGSDIYIGSSLVDMYAKCGSIENARQAFDRMPRQDLISWTAMITGYSQHGFNKEVFLLFQQMLQEGVNPDEITFLCILSACSHLGLVDQGLQYFYSMTQLHNLTPTLEHYSCIVDMFGRVGCLIGAIDFIDKMPFEPGAVVWKTLLGACKNHGNVQLAKHVSQHILKLDPEDAAALVLLSNTYAAAGG